MPRDPNSRSRAMGWLSAMSPAEREAAMDALDKALAARAEADTDLSWAEYMRSVATTEEAEAEAAVEAVDAQRRAWNAEDDVRRIFAKFPECRLPWPVVSCRG